MCIAEANKLSRKRKSANAEVISGPGAIFGLTTGCGLTLRSGVSIADVGAAVVNATAATITVVQQRATNVALGIVRNIAAALKSFEKLSLIVSLR